MKTEELIREYIRTHEEKKDEGKRAGLRKPPKPVTPLTHKGR